MGVKSDKNKRAVETIKRLQIAYPDSKCSLIYNHDYELLIATILSAQCTDARVNKTTETLFKKYPSLESFAYADINSLANDIHSCGYHNQKAKSIKGATVTILEEWGGKLPENMDDLIKLPGVGRKTANCVLGECFSIPAMVIDTHMIRIMNLLGFTTKKDPKKIEIELMSIFPRENWIQLTHMVIDHGRKICIARRPDCMNCILSDICPSARSN
jgi:endonuclease-3